MRIKFFPLVLLLALSLLTACSGDEMDNLDGKWVVDREALREMLKAEIEASVQMGLDQGMIKQTVDSIADTMNLDFDISKQEVRRNINGQEFVLKYTVVSESSKEIRINVDNIVSVITLTGKDSFSIREGDSNIEIPMIRAKN